jgi:poly(A) polymerase
VHDPLGGLADLLARRVRFIGDAAARIEEDYLRILRFFRFTAEYCAGAPDAVGLAACVRLAGGLQTLSAERIRTELLKILVAPRATDISHIMQQHDFWQPLLGLAADPVGLSQMVAIAPPAGAPPDAITRLAALAVTTPADADHLAHRLKLSTEDWLALSAIGRFWRRIDVTMDRPALRRLLHEAGRPAASAAILVAWARAGTLTLADPSWASLLDAARTLPMPEFPLRGRDVLACGVAPGPRVGVILARLQAWWIEGDFAANRAVLLARLSDDVTARE